MDLHDGVSELSSRVSHHLKLAGRSDTLFSDDAADLIHQVSRGLPRAVNNLAVQALVAAFANNKTIVDESSARAAVSEVTQTDDQTDSTTMNPAGPPTGGVLLISTPSSASATPPSSSDAAAYT